MKLDRKAVVRAGADDLGRIAPLAVCLASDATRGVSGQLVAVHDDEIFLDCTADVFTRDPV